MTQLQVRRPEFRIDDTVPFQWQPDNPVFGIFCNVFTFIAIAFERYLVSVTRDAMKVINHPAVLGEADAFLRQEAQHAKAHFKHAKALIAQYPGLQTVLTDATKSYDALYEREPLEFHVAYIADLEATFTPLFKMMIDNRASLFAGGDDRVGPLFLWHFIEEIEHRSSALLIHRAVNVDKWYRLRVARKVFAHVTGVYADIVRGFEANVPYVDGKIPVRAAAPGRLVPPEIRRRLPRSRRRDHPYPTMLERVSGRDLRHMIWRLTLSQLPSHNPAVEPLPMWAADWHAAYNATGDVASYAAIGL